MQKRTNDGKRGKVEVGFEVLHLTGQEDKFFPSDKVTSQSAPEI